MIQIGREKFSEQQQKKNDASLCWDPSGIGGSLFVVLLALLRQVLARKKIAIWEMAPRMVLKRGEIDPCAFLLRFLGGL